MYVDLSTSSRFLVLKSTDIVFIPIGDGIILPATLAQGSVKHSALTPFLAPRA